MNRWVIPSCSSDGRLELALRRSRRGIGIGRTYGSSPAVEGDLEGQVEELVGFRKGPSHFGEVEVRPRRRSAAARCPAGSPPRPARTRSATRPECWRCGRRRRWWPTVPPVVRLQVADQLDHSPATEARRWSAGARSGSSSTRNARLPLTVTSSRTSRSSTTIRCTDGGRTVSAKPPSRWRTVLVARSGGPFPGHVEIRRLAQTAGAHKIGEVDRDRRPFVGSGARTRSRPPSHRHDAGSAVRDPPRALASRTVTIARSPSRPNSSRSGSLGSAVWTCGRRLSCDGSLSA